MSEAEYGCTKISNGSWSLYSSKVNDNFAVIKWNHINQSVSLLLREGYRWHSIESVRFVYFKMKEMLEEKSK